MASAYVITLSDKGSEGLRDDQSGPTVAQMLTEAGLEVTGTAILPDDMKTIEKRLRELSSKVDLIVTTGGTGLSPRDVTPEATLNVIEREVPGIAEAMRAYGMKKTDRAMLSRGVAGIVGNALIINLPGSPKAASESLEAVIGTLGHAIEKLKGSTEDCAAEDK